MILRDNMVMERFDDTALRVLIDLRDAYDATLALWRSLDAHEGRMVWKTVSQRDYLYHVFGRQGRGKSLGPRSRETEAIYEQFRSRKHDIKSQLADTEPDLKRAAAMYTATALPVIDSWAAKLFQHLDRSELLGSHVLVVGTNALPAYQIEAQVRLGQRIHATRDTDIAWVDASAADEPMLWPVLREFDDSFRVNLERPFQAIGRGSRELELLENMRCGCPSRTLRQRRKLAFGFAILFASWRSRYGGFLLPRNTAKNSISLLSNARLSVKRR